ncbi:MAG: hypothetical protein KC613_16795, partial [Myxococcales bacterium]|nr:hypothetical protein [Myxococcales bacterium]
MHRIVLLAATLLAAALWVNTAAAQPEQVCLLEERNAGQGLSLAVDQRGTLHMLYVVKLSGDLRHLTVAPDGQTASEVVAPRISRLAIDEVRHPDLVLVGGVPTACWYSAADVEVVFGRRGDDGWVTEVIDDAMGVTDGCAVVEADGRLWVLYRGAQGLVAAWRQDGGGWRSEVVEPAPGGLQPHAVALADGTLVVASHDGAGQLFV